jgi:hypothetical protein
MRLSVPRRSGVVLALVIGSAPGLGAQAALCFIPRPGCDIVALTDAGVELSLLSTHHSGRSRDIGDRFAATGGFMGIRGVNSYGVSGSWLYDGGGSGTRFEIRYRRAFQPTGELGANLGYEQWETGTSGTSAIRRQWARGPTLSGQLDYRWVGLDARVSMLQVPAGPVRSLAVGARIRERAAWIATGAALVVAILFVTHPPD